MSNKRNTKQAQGRTVVEGASQVAAGRKSKKEVHASLGFGEVPEDYRPSGSGLDIDAALKKELDDNDLSYRFINFKTYKNRGFHKAKWVPYKRESTPAYGATFTMDPDGYTVNQDLVLAVKPKDWQDAHRKFLRQKAAALSDPQKVKAEELQQHIQEAGSQSKVVVGYEEDKN